MGSSPLSGCNRCLLRHARDLPSVCGDSSEQVPRPRIGLGTTERNSNLSRKSLTCMALCVPSNFERFFVSRMTYIYGIAQIQV